MNIKYYQYLDEKWQDKTIGLMEFEASEYDHKVSKDGDHEPVRRQDVDKAALVEHTPCSTGSVSDGCMDRCMTW